MGVNLVALGNFQFQNWGFTNPFLDHEFLYMSWNAACVEVEVDVLTGTLTQILNGLKFLQNSADYLVRRMGAGSGRYFARHR
jgi:hypothetical protein